MDLLAFIITLLLVLDPFGNIPVFLSILHSVEPQKRLKIIVREQLIALAVLVLFFFFGTYILAGLQISSEAVSIAGAVVLFLIAIKMIFPQNPNEHDQLLNQDPLIVPLAIPLVAGPSAISYLILAAKRWPNDLGIGMIGILIAWALSTIILASSSFLARILGKRVLSAIERLMGMILITLSVQMLLDGLKALRLFS